MSFCFLRVASTRFDVLSKIKLDIFVKSLDMLSVPLAEAKNRLSELILRAEGGEDVAITKRGKPMVRLVPVAESALDRQAEVAEVFRRLSLLSRGMRLEGDLKAIAREGLD